MHRLSADFGIPYLDSVTTIGTTPEEGIGAGMDRCSRASRLR